MNQTLLESLVITRGEDNEMYKVYNRFLSDIFITKVHIFTFNILTYILSMLVMAHSIT